MTGITFDSLVAAHRRELLAHCYRLLGSFTDAEDVLQETLLAAWRGIDDFEHRSSIRTWLYRIATNRCLNWMRDRSRRVPSEPIPPFTPPAPDARDTIRWLQPYPDAAELPDTVPGPEARYSSRESIELAFVEALQHLTPRQAAALVLTDVLGFRRAEAAAMLDVTPTAVKALLQRARAALAERHDPRRSPQAPGSAAESVVAQRFARAFEADDVDALLELLTEDAWLSMPPAPHRYLGRDSVGAFLRVSTDWRVAAGYGLRLDPLRANGQPGFACQHVGNGDVHAVGLMVLTLTGDRVSGIHRFLP